MSKIVQKIDNMIIHNFVILENEKRKFAEAYRTAVIENSEYNFERVIFIALFKAGIKNSFIFNAISL